MTKFFYEGNCTKFGISLSDLPAPDAFHYMITKISDYISLYIGIPEIITVQDLGGILETITFNLPTKLGVTLFWLLKNIFTVIKSKKLTF